MTASKRHRKQAKSGEVTILTSDCLAVPAHLPELNFPSQRAMSSSQDCADCHPESPEIPQQKEQKQEQQTAEQAAEETQETLTEVTLVEDVLDPATFVPPSPLPTPHITIEFCDRVCSTLSMS